MISSTNHQVLGTGEMTQWLKCLQLVNKDLNFISSIHVLVAHNHYSGTEEVEAGFGLSSWAHWPGSVAQLVNAEFC